jgi:hypothetical protein
MVRFVAQSDTLGADSSFDCRYICPETRLRLSDSVFGSISNVPFKGLSSTKPLTSPIDKSGTSTTVSDIEITTSGGGGGGGSGGGGGGGGIVY